MRRLVPLVVPISLGLLACGGSEPTSTAGPCGTPSTSLQPVRAAIAEPIPAAGAGTATLEITGTPARRLTGRATAYEVSLLAAVTVIDAFVVDAAGRPTAELLIVLTSRAVPQTAQLLPVTLAQLRDPTYRPDGPFAVFAESYDGALNDYQRWLVETEGCVRITASTSGRVGRVAVGLELDGAWRSPEGAPLGRGSLQGTIDAPLLRMRSPSGSLADTLEGSITLDAVAPALTSDVDAFQVLAADQTRLTVIATVAGDPLREIWLSLRGVPQAGDSVPLRAPSVDEAVAGRSTESFGMVRITSQAGAQGERAMQQLWRSTSGFVKFTNMVQNGPLAICGWTTAAYEFEAAGTDMTGPMRDALPGTLRAAGRFETRITVLPPADTLVGASTGVARPERTPLCPF